MQLNVEVEMQGGQAMTPIPQKSGAHWFFGLLFIAALCLSLYWFNEGRKIIPPEDIIKIAPTTASQDAQKGFFEILEKYYQNGALLLAGFIGFVFIETKEKPIFTLKHSASWLSLIVVIVMMGLFFYRYECLMLDVIQRNHDLGPGIKDGSILDFWGCKEIRDIFEKLRLSFYSSLGLIFLSASLIYTRGEE